jgi:Arc/MetJ-type ribon-helix-helix transcriptional regulator
MEAFLMASSVSLGNLEMIVERLVSSGRYNSKSGE